LYKELATSNLFEVKVFYTWSQAQNNQKFDPGFGKSITWDIPLLEGYQYTFVNNIAKKTGSHHFFGINNPTLCKEIEEFKATHVLVYGWSFKSHLKAIRHFKNKIPVLFRGDSTLLDETKNFKSILRKHFLTWVYKHIDKALYVGENNKQYFLKYGLQDSQLIFAPHAIDNIRFQQPALEYQKEAIAIKETLGILPTNFVLLFVGKFETKKNPLLLLNALKKINDSNLQLIFVGNGNLEATLQQQAGNNPNIKFLPFQNQQKMPAIYRLANVLVLPSQGPHETWGLAINEAMACGVAAIASNKCGGAIDLIENNKTGFIFESNSVDSLVTAIQNSKTVFANNNETSSSKIANKIKQFSYATIKKTIEQEVSK
jgi:glycosyltransferase involved in cell wall biosynthesis